MIWPCYFIVDLPTLFSFIYSLEKAQVYSILASPKNVINTHFCITSMELRELAETQKHGLLSYIFCDIDVDECPVVNIYN